MRLACTRLDHIDVAAAAGKEDDEEREKAQAVALSAGSVCACCRRLVGGRGICSLGLLNKGKARESKTEGPCSWVEDAKGHYLGPTGDIE